MLALGIACGSRLVSAETDLDAFMQRVLARRDDNWRKLQQYILDEREAVDVRGPAGARFWGDEREYTWFIREGYFVRSPVKFNGVAIGDADRRKYEAEFLDRERRRERGGPGLSGGTARSESGDALRDVNGLNQQTREPRFISSAYFLRFRFDEGKYALVGREQLNGREVLRIEYYPSKLFPEGRRGPGRLGSSPVDAETRKLLNKVALITLWIDPNSNQILKYTFDNIDFDFLPARWLVRLDTVRASMAMGQPFPEIWLPQDIQIDVGLELAIGEVNVRYQLAYHNYRRADVTSTLKVLPER
jgi:hypothetical protein